MSIDLERRPLVGAARQELLGLALRSLPRPWMT
jgi:hypothetical protein